MTHIGNRSVVPIAFFIDIYKIVPPTKAVS